MTGDFWVSRNRTLALLPKQVITANCEIAIVITFKRTFQPQTCSF